jgi:hypothetical protein
VGGSERRVSSPSNRRDARQESSFQRPLIFRSCRRAFHSREGFHIDPVSVKWHHESESFTVVESTIVRSRERDIMLTLNEIERAVEGLTTEQRQALRRFLDQSFDVSSVTHHSEHAHSVLDIPAITIGPLLRPLDANDDLLNEMLEGRP